MLHSLSVYTSGVYLLFDYHSQILILELRWGILYSLSVLQSGVVLLFDLIFLGT